MHRKANLGWIEIDKAQTCLQNITGSQFGVVVIGRNEGQRLVTCFNSIHDAVAVVYVNSNSTDGSVMVAKNLNIDVVQLDLSIPFTAARARNAGLMRLHAITPDLRYVQFVDGDCQLIKGWAEAAVSFLERMPDVAAVCGRFGSDIQSDPSTTGCATESGIGRPERSVPVREM